MPTYSQPYPLVYPEQEYRDAAGNTYAQFSLGPYSPGHFGYTRPEKVSRPRPSQLIAESALTAHGGLTEQRYSRAPVTLVFPMWDGGSMILRDVDPSSYAVCGQALAEPNVDWQTALRLAVKDQRINLAQTMAEYRQVQSMFVKNATAIGKSILDLRRGQWKRAAKHVNVDPQRVRSNVSNRLLEVQYGWRPLINDLNGAVEEFEAALQRPRYRKMTVKKKGFDRLVQETDIFVPRKTRAVLDCEWTVRTKVVAYLKQDSSVASRLGLTNPLVLGWELLPYSFVLDWLIPVGNWLNSLDAEIGLIHVYGTVSTRAKMISTQTFGGQIYTFRRYQRDVFSGLPSARFPEYKPSLGVERIANALALLSQLKR